MSQVTLERPAGASLLGLIGEVEVEDARLALLEYAKALGAYHQKKEEGMGDDDLDTLESNATLTEQNLNLHFLLVPGVKKVMNAVLDFYSPENRSGTLSDTLE